MSEEEKEEIVNIYKGKTNEEKVKIFQELMEKQKNESDEKHI